MGYCQPPDRCSAIVQPCLRKARSTAAVMGRRSGGSCWPFGAAACGSGCRVVAVVGGSGSEVLIGVSLSRGCLWYAGSPRRRSRECPTAQSPDLCVSSDGLGHRCGLEPVARIRLMCRGEAGRYCGRTVGSAGAEVEDLRLVGLSLVEAGLDRLGGPLSELATRRRRENSRYVTRH